MTRKFLAIFSITFAVSLLFSVLFFGEHGFFYQKALKRQINDLEYQQEKLQVEVDGLKDQNNRKTSGEGLKDAAFKLGYKSEGEQIYFFTDDVPAKQDEPSNERHTDQDYAYFWLPLWALVLISLVMAIIVMLLYAKRVRRRGQGYGQRK